MFLGPYVRWAVSVETELRQSGTDVPKGDTLRLRGQEESRPVRRTLPPSPLLVGDECRRFPTPWTPSSRPDVVVVSLSF